MQQPIQGQGYPDRVAAWGHQGDAGRPSQSGGAADPPTAGGSGADIAHGYPPHGQPSVRRPSAEFQQPTGAYPPHLPHASASGPVQRHGAARFPSASSPTASHPGASPSFATSPNPPFAPGLSLGSVDPSIAPGAPEAKTADPGARRHAPRTPMGRVQAAWDGMSPNARIASVVGAMVIAIVLLWAVVRDPDSLFMVAEAVHFVGLALLIWKISAKRSVAGLSLGMQVMTALFLGVRFYCSLRMEVNWSQPLSDLGNVHSLLDGAAFGLTCWVLFQMLGPLSATYKANKDLDSLNVLYLLVPCGILACVIYPAGNYATLDKMLWAFALYAEAVSNLPQLYMFQNAKIVERFTGHYVFCLALSRFLCLAHWVLQLVDRNGTLVYALGRGPWAALVLIAEGVQTFILTDFTLLYISAYARGIPVVRVAEGIV